MAKLKIKLLGKYIGSRFILSVLIAAAVDSTLFSIIAFYGVINSNDLIKFVLTMWLIKIIIVLLVLPFTVRFANKIKLAEYLDIYDIDTLFNIFSLDTNYIAKDNKINKENEKNG